METPRPFDLTGKVALVTGAGRGLGVSMATELARAGAYVVPSARTTSEIEKTAAHIHKAGGQAATISGDISTRAGCRKLVQEVIDQHGRLDILVCNAATNIFGPALEIDEDMWNACLATELNGYFFLAQAAVDLIMKTARQGTIIMIGANSSIVGYNDLITVAAAKGGIDSVARNLAVEFGEFNIRVNTVNPGYTETPPEEGDVIPGYSGDLEEDIRGMTPLQRRGRIEEFAYATVFLASDAASFITGQCLAVDGGYSIK